MELPMQLREDQQRMVDDATSGLKQGKRTFQFVAPTAWGKTPVLSVVADVAARHLGPGATILWVAHRDRLLLQGIDTMHRICPDALGRCVFLNTASPRLMQADVLAIDECHHDAARTYQRMRVVARPSIVIACTATAQRHDRLGLNFEVVLTAPDTDDLIAQGILAEFEHFALDAPTLPEHLVTAFLDSPERWGRSIIFAYTIEEVHRCVARLRAAEIAAAPTLGDPTKEAAMEAFTAGRIQVLVACHALTEGVDLPAVQSVFIRDSIRAPVMQAVGRALRRHGAKIANVIQFSSAKIPYFTIARPRRRWVATLSCGWTELPVEPSWPSESTSTKSRITQRYTTSVAS